MSKKSFEAVLLYNIKTFQISTVLCSILVLIYLIVISVIFKSSYSDFIFQGEYILSLTGILLVTNCAKKELTTYREVLTVKKVGISPFIVTKLAMAFIFLLLIISSYVFVFAFITEIPSIIQSIIGLYVNAFVLGCIGFIAYCISKNTALGYFTAFFYYLFEVMTQGSFTQDLFLFGLSKGYDIKGKVYLLLISAIILILFIKLYLFAGDKKVK